MIGKTISHFKIIKKIGAGGMGEVYLAEDTELARKVALKFLPPHYSSDSEIITRFKREAKTAASLNHPNIITVHEVGQHGGQTFIAMEHVEGESLRELIVKGKLPLSQTLQIGAQICDGLAKAHQADIVHRDIKPENIMIGKDGRVRILDFGLAKLRGATKLTRKSSTLGTLNYMSPEQFQGVEADHRTDIWSVGVVLYEMIAHQLPFQGEYEAAMMYSVLNEQPAPMSLKASEVPAQLELIVNKAISKNPEERYPAISELATDIRILQTGTSEPSTKPVKKKASWLKKALLAFGGFMLVLLGALAWFIYPFLYIPEPIQKQHDKAIAVLFFDNMSREEDEYFSDGLTEELISRLNRIQNLKVASRTDVRIYKMSPATVSAIGEDLNVDYVVEGSVRKSSNRIRVAAQLVSSSDGSHRWSDTYERELTDIFAVQDDVASNIATGLEMEISNDDRSAILARPTENIEAYELVLRAKSKLFMLTALAPDSAFEEIHSMCDQSVESDPDYVDARTLLCVSYLIHLMYRGSFLDPSKRHQLQGKAILAADQVLATDPRNLIALSILPVTLIMKITGQLSGDEGFKPLLYRRAKIQINSLIKFYPDSPLANLALGMYHSMLSNSRLTILTRDELQMALDYNLRALSSSQKVIRVAPNDPMALFIARVSSGRLGGIYFRRGKYLEALKYFNKEDEIYKKSLNKNKNSELLSTLRLGATYYRFGEYDEALAYFERLLELANELRHTGQQGEILNLIEGQTVHLIGETKYLMGEYSEACEYFEQAGEIWIDIGDERQHLWTLSWEAVSQLKIGNLETTIAKAKQAEEILKATGPSPGDAIIVNWNLSQVYAGLGQKTRSQSFLKLAHDTFINKANEIADAEARETFLHKTRENREVVLAWEKLKR